MKLGPGESLNQNPEEDETRTGRKRKPEPGERLNRNPEKEHT